MEAIVEHFPHATNLAAGNLDVQFRDCVASSGLLEPGTPPPESLRILVDLAMVLSQATGVAVALAEPGEVVCRAASGALASDVGRQIDARSGLVGLCLRTGELLLSTDVSTDDRTDRIAADDLGARSAVAIPLCNRGKTLGVLEAISTDLDTFDARALRNLKGLAGVIANIIPAQNICKEVSQDSERSVMSGLGSVAPLPYCPFPRQDRLATLGPGNSQRHTDVASGSHTALAIAILVASLALLCGVIFIYPWHRSQRSVNSHSLASRPDTLQSRTVQPPEQPNPTPTTSAKAGVSSQPRNNSELAQVTGIRYSSHEGFTDVIIELNAAVHYDAHHFHNPERIYFDLHSTHLASELGPWGRTFKVDDTFLVNVRVAQHEVGLTRVVLDTKGILRWSANFAASSPELLIRVGRQDEDLKRRLPVAVPAPVLRDTTDSAGQKPHATVIPGLAPSNKSRTWAGAVDSVRHGRELRAIYLTGETAASARGEQLIDTWRGIGGNAIVFDIKDSTGIVNIPFHHPLNQDASPRVTDLRKFVAYLHSHGMYAIGRIALFRDERLVSQHPELAVRSRLSGDPWREKGQLAWVDPSNPEVQEYNLALAKTAAVAGVDEIQLDYVRFPVQGNQKDMRFAIDSQRLKWRRSEVITRFVSRVYSQLHPLGVRLSVDIFGVLAWNHMVDVASTGQDVRALMHHCDVISPMLYPSHFFHMDGYIHPGDAPRHFVSGAMRRFVTMTTGTRISVRPWLQGFSWQTSTYSPQYVLQEIHAAENNGGLGFIFWNAENEYSEPFAALLAMHSTDFTFQNSSR